MKLNKPKFWDYKKPSLLAFMLFPLTFPIFIANLFKANYAKKKFNEIKTICIGNIYLGGTGKTPLSIKINDFINKQNFKSTVIKKFYLNQSDEQKLIKKNTNLICKIKRIDALKEAREKGFQYAIFDDGLQDKSINYDLKIVCFNNSQWKGNGFLIPAGPLRENIKAIKNYDIIILNGKKNKNTHIIDEIKKISREIKIFETCYKLENLNDFDLKQNYVAFSGIGNPQNFVDTLIENEFKIIKDFTFPDHHEYKDNNLSKIINFADKKNAKIITTEKDYMRINEKFFTKINFLKLELIISDEKNFFNLLTNK
jgi:tetraacyldisaccharide 4'-kinase